MAAPTRAVVMSTSTSPTRSPPRQERFGIALRPLDCQTRVERLPLDESQRGPRLWYTHSYSPACVIASLFQVIAQLSPSLYGRVGICHPGRYRLTRARGGIFQPGTPSHRRRRRET